MTRSWHYLFESDASVQELKRTAIASKAESDWEAYEGALRRIGRDLDAYRSYAVRSFPRKGWYILYEAIDEAFNIQGPYRKRMSRSVAAVFRYMHASPRSENRLHAIKQGPWVDYDAPEVISAPVYGRLFGILSSWAYRAGHRQDNPNDYQLYIRDTNGDIREEMP